MLLYFAAKIHNNFEKYTKILFFERISNKYVVKLLYLCIQNDIIKILTNLLKQ